MSIAIEQLTVAFNHKAVIEDLSLVIPQGCFFTLLGPSGCGKTTLLRTIAGFTPAEKGRLLFGNKDVIALPAHQRDIGMVFQDYALFPDRSVFDNVAYGLIARGWSRERLRPAVLAMLDHVELTGLHDRLPAALSGGQRQRVALARALVIKPQLLLMDEPLSNLDTKLRIQMRSSIGKLQKEVGITTIFVTHDQEEALALSDLIGVMNNGKIEQIGSPQDIYQTPRTAFVANFVGGANLMPLPELSSPIGQGYAQVQSPLGPLKAFSHHQLEAHHACLMIRPEDINLSLDTGLQANHLPCRIMGKHYLGSKTHYDIVLPDRTELVVHLSGQGHERYAIGQSLFACFEAENALLVHA
jgi:iron(III) transport system ATP-binding protein